MWQEPRHCCPYIAWEIRLSPSQAAKRNIKVTSASEAVCKKVATTMLHLPLAKSFKQGKRESLQPTRTYLWDQKVRLFRPVH